MQPPPAVGIALTVHAHSTVTSVLQEKRTAECSRRVLGVQVWSVAWQTDGSKLASASDDKSVAFYNLA